MGTGKGIRDFFYITDAAEAICRYAECPATNSHTNISSGKGTVIHELADAIANSTGVDNITYSNNPDQDGVPVKILDNTKMQKDIGIWDYISIKQGIEKTVNHIKEKG
jgi:nucleoside-diphosphate-sugar epimerase